MGEKPSEVPAPGMCRRPLRALSSPASQCNREGRIRKSPPRNFLWNNGASRESSVTAKQSGEENLMENFIMGSKAETPGHTASLTPLKGRRPDAPAPRRLSRSLAGSRLGPAGTLQSQSRGVSQPGPGTHGCRQVRESERRD